MMVKLEEVTEEGRHPIYKRPGIVVWLRKTRRRYRGMFLQLGKGRAAVCIYDLRCVIIGS